MLTLDFECAEVTVSQARCGSMLLQESLIEATIDVDARPTKSSTLGESFDRIDYWRPKGSDGVRVL